MRLVDQQENVREVWIWGSSPKGLLGIGPDVRKAPPTRIDFFNDKSIVQITASESHFAALSGPSPFTFRLSVLFLTSHPFFFFFSMCDQQRTEKCTCGETTRTTCWEWGH